VDKGQAITEWENIKSLAKDIDERLRSKVGYQNAFYRGITSNMKLMEGYIKAIREAILEEFRKS